MKQRNKEREAEQIIIWPLLWVSWCGFYTGNIGFGLVLLIASLVIAIRVWTTKPYKGDDHEIR